MLKSSKLLFALVSLTVSILFFSCATESDSSEAAESKSNLEVVYSVEFPFIKDKTLLKWFPTEYKAIIGKHELYGEMNSKMNVICNRFYANEKEKVIFQTLENMSGNYSCEMEALDVSSFLDGMLEMIISEPIADTTILGVNCKVSIAAFKIDSVPAVKLYHTNDFGIENPNWYNQYRDLNSFLMGYEIEQFGMRMKLMATSLTKVNRPIHSELVYGDRKPGTYDHKKPKELQKVYKDMLNDFIE